MSDDVNPQTSGETTWSSDEHHRLVVDDRDADGYPSSVRFVCDGGSAAPCHQYPACDCEVWDDDCREAGHEPVPHDGCWAVPWFDWIDSPLDWVETCNDRDVLIAEDLVSGPVNTHWMGDGLDWSYRNRPEQLTAEGVR